MRCSASALRAASRSASRRMRSAASIPASRSAGRPGTCSQRRPRGRVGLDGEMRRGDWNVMVDGLNRLPLNPWLAGLQHWSKSALRARSSVHVEPVLEALEQCARCPRLKVDLSNCQSSVAPLLRHLQNHLLYPPPRARGIPNRSRSALAAHLRRKRHGRDGLRLVRLAGHHLGDDKGGGVDVGRGALHAGRGMEAGILGRVGQGSIGRQGQQTEQAGKQAGVPLTAQALQQPSCPVHSCPGRGRAWRALAGTCSLLHGVQQRKKPAAAAAAAATSRGDAPSCPQC